MASSQGYLQASQSHRKRFSKEGFHPLGTEQSNMSSNDATIDIPLEQINTTTSSGGGLRRGDSSAAAAFQPQYTNQSSNPEKRSFFRGRRTKPDPALQKTGHVGYDGEEDILTTMGKVYSKFFSFSIVTRYLFYVVPVGILIAVPIVVGVIIQNSRNQQTPPGQPPKLAGVPIVWFFTWVEIVWVSLWVSKTFAHFLPYVFQILVGVVSSGVRKYATVLRKLEIPISLVGWAVTSLATFVPLMTQNPWNSEHDSTQKHWETIVQEILGAAVASSLVYLVEKAVIQLISINYHRKQFNARIKDSKRHIYVLGLLYDASRALFPAYCNEFAEEDYIIADQLQIANLTGKKRRGHGRTGSTTPLRLIQNIGRFGDHVTSAFGNVAHEITGKEVFNPNSSHSVVVEALEKKATSEALARRIWMSFVVEGRESLLQEDITDVLGPDRGEAAEEAFWALDRDGNGDVSLDEMILTVTEYGRERKAIANSMVDVAQAINVLDRLLLSVVCVAVVFIFIAFLNRSFVTTLATAGTALLSLSFVFAGTAQEVLGSCIFLFVKHPFDIGDRVDIAADQFTVEHISLLFTVFRRVSGLKTGQLCQYPNIVLNGLSLDNVSRSKAMTEQITLDVAFDTSFDDIQILKNEMKNFVTDSNNDRDFLPDLEIEVLGTSDMSKMQLRVEIRHKSNWANETLRAARRSKFMCALVTALRAVPINAPGGGGDAAGSAANPNYSVSISDMEAKENSQASTEKKAKARLVPVKKVQAAKDFLSPTDNGGKVHGMTGMSYHDAKVIDDLNARDPTSDPARDGAWTSGRDDSSTLGERPSVDRQDLEDVKGVLRRASTRGKRRPGTELSSRIHAPTIPTINEPAEQPQPYGYAVSSHPAYAPPSAMTTTAYHPALRNQPPAPVPSPYESAAAAQFNTEMSQVAHSTSHPYRNRSDSGSRQPLSPTTAGRDRDEDDFENLRPYSGV